MTFNLVAMATSLLKKHFMLRHAIGKTEEPLRALVSQNKTLKNLRGVGRKFRDQRGLK